jgi:DNA-binding NarL/FixJ family response regulator
MKAGDPEPIRVLLADDHPVVRAGLRGMLAAEPGIEVAGEAGSGPEAVALARVSEYDVILMDLRMPGGDGVTATEQILAADPGARVLVLTTYETDADILRAVEAGATGYLLKDATPAELADAVRAAARGETVLAPSVAEWLVSRVRRPQRELLSARETEVLAQAARGRTNAEIGRALFISEATVKTHLLRAFGKLGVSGRTAAVTTAIERGLLTPPGQDLPGKGGEHERAVGQVGQHGVRARRRQVRRGVGAGGDRDDAGAGGQGRLHVKRRVADEHGRGAAEVRSVGPAGRPPGHRDQFGPDLVHVPVGADVQVEVFAQPGQAELHRRERPDIAGEDGLADPPGRGERRDRAGRAGHRTYVRADRPVRRGHLPGQRGEKTVDLGPRLGYPGLRERVQGDRAVGPPGLGRNRGQLTAEQLPEDHLVQPRPQAVGTHQRVVNVPEHKQISHPPRLVKITEPRHTWPWGICRRAGLDSRRRLRAAGRGGG